jgi:hypothetical protein
MAQTDSENVASKSSDNKTRFSFLSPISRFIREISVPAFLAFLGWIFSQSLAKQSAELQESLAKQSTELQESLARQSTELQRAMTQQSIGKDYVGIAVSILERPKDEEHNALRDWAVNLLVRYSPEPFSPKAKEQLEYRGLTEYRQSAPRSLSPDGTKEAMTRQSPGGYWYLSVIAPGTSRDISMVDVSPAGWSLLVWSKDGSKLLVCWQNEGRVAAFDVPKEPSISGVVPRSKLLGDYQTKGSSGRIESLSFSPDGRSVTINEADGKTEVWQLP